MSSPSSIKPLNIFVHCLDGTGHLNACIGLGQALASRGHTVTFLITELFKGQVTASFGLREIILYDTSKSTEAKEPSANAHAIAEELFTNGLLGPGTPLQKMRTVCNWLDIVYTETVAVNGQLEEAIRREGPDLILLDHVFVPPAVLATSLPYMTVFSGNPLTVYQTTALPPPCSGYPTASDPSTWAEFREIFDKGFLARIGTLQGKLNAEFGYEAKADERFEGFLTSPLLNIYGYPLELDYQSHLPLPANTIQVDAFCRKLPEKWTVPEELQLKPGDKLLYVSMGSIGSFDMKLNQKIAAVLGKTPYKVIFCKGPMADEWELPGNCWGKAYLPQTSILPLVDLVVTHGGNNTVTETFSSGKPMIVMPLFADQFENAQRIQETGFGLRLEPYTFTEDQLIDAIKCLLDDAQLKGRLEAAAKRIEASQSKERACEEIEKQMETLNCQ